MSRRIRCAHCKSVEGHQTVAQVKLCAKRVAEAAELTAREEYEAKVEAMAEQAAERFFEERGGPEPEDPREAEARMLEEERRFDALIQQREIEQDRAAAAAKMAGESWGLGSAVRRRPW